MKSRGQLVLKAPREGPSQYTGRAVVRSRNFHDRAKRRSVTITVIASAVRSGLSLVEPVAHRSALHGQHRLLRACDYGTSYALCATATDEVGLHAKRDPIGVRPYVESDRETRAPCLGRQKPVNPATCHSFCMTGPTKYRARPERVRPMPDFPAHDC